MVDWALKKSSIEYIYIYICIYNIYICLLTNHSRRQVGLSLALCREPGDRLKSMVNETFPLRRSGQSVGVTSTLVPKVWKVLLQVNRVETAVHYGVSY